MFDPKTRVLVVDDMSTMRMLTVKLLGDLGFTDITEAADGEAAWNSILSASPSFGLILSDWNMPKLNGIGLVKKLRADPKHKKVPLLLITTESEKGKVVEAVMAQVDDYIVKPFTLQVLTEKLTAIYKRRTAA
jgi:two-component system chemotaxis response regulator CheY